MADVRPSKRLRTYLLAFFIPLTGLPLVILAGLTYFLVGRAVNEEIARRSQPELAAVSRNLDSIEKRLSRQLLELSRREDLKNALTAKNLNAIQSDLGTWMAGAYFEK